MSLLPDSASFHERVADLFAAFRGRGVALSALDVELVDSWSKTGAPFEVVARGIRRAAEGALFDAPESDRGLRSLAACTRSVEAELKKFADASAGKTGEPEETETAPLELKRHKKLKSALKRTARLDPRLTSAATHLADTIREPKDFDASQRNEDLAHAVLLHALPWPERSGLLQEARQLVQKAPAMSARARRESRRLHRAALLRRTLSLPAFW